MEERPVPLDYVLDDEIADSYAHQQSDQHAVSRASARPLLHHEHERREYPDKTVIARRCHRDHEMIHERGIKVIVKPFEVPKLELAETADLLIGLVLYLPCDMLSLLYYYSFHRLNCNTRPARKGIIFIHLTLVNSGRARENISRS